MYFMYQSIETDAANSKPNLIVKNCEITNVYRYGDPEFSADGNILNITTGGRAGAMLFENCIFSNTGDEALRSINTHKSPVSIRRCICYIICSKKFYI